MFARSFPRLAVLIAFLCCLTTGSLVYAQVWIEDTFEDFADGRLDASGQNIYVSRDGKVRTIHRFDLNGDGFIDLLFNSTHDEYNLIPATLAQVDKSRCLDHAPLAVEGSQRAVCGDLNRDGHLDIVFCPNPSGFQRRYITMIWGSSDGLSARRCNGQLPVNNAQSVVLADLNRDQWPDIVTLNGEAWLPGQPEGGIVRIYWGAKDGFLLSRRLDIGVPGAVDLASADFDQDGASDVAILQTDKLRLLWSTDTGSEPSECESTEVLLPKDDTQCVTAADCDADGMADLVVGTKTQTVFIVPGRSARTWGQAKQAAAFDASQIAVGDLDSDGRPDLVLTEFGVARAAGGEVVGAEGKKTEPIHILWGSESGFDASHATPLAVQNASASAIGDIDGDGRMDLAVAVFQSEHRYAADSRIFWGTGKRHLVLDNQAIPTQGAVWVAVTPPKGELPARMIFCNSRGGMLKEQVPLLLYLGSKDGFDVRRRIEIPFAGGYEASAADLNMDGFIDLMAMNSGHGGKEAATEELGANIFWGSAEVFNPSRRSILKHYGLWASNIADLNRDGYLDIVLGQFSDDKQEQPEEVFIYYGSADGFESGQCIRLASKGRSSGCLVADFDNDTWLDIAVASFKAHCVRIFWGDPAGYNTDRQDRLTIPSPIAIETADLNADGYLDLIAGSYYDEISGIYGTGTIIFWGSQEGFKYWDAQRLPSSAPVGLTVADFDGDGFLDLFTPNYHEGLRRESMPCYLFWGGAGGFAPRQRTIFICDSPSDSLAADFDYDGKLDLAVSCHSRDGDHRTVSKVFYNDGQRFENPKIVKLPAPGPHWSWLQDMGHIYNRKWQQTYESSVFSWDNSATGGLLDFLADIPDGTHLTFEIRTAADVQHLQAQPWRVLDSQQFKFDAHNRCMQYRALFKSDNGDRYPILDKVTVKLDRVFN